MCSSDLAVVTSFEPDHLDWHGGVQAYRDAKARIFTLLKPGGMSLAPSDWSDPKPSRTFVSDDGLADYVLDGDRVQWANGFVNISHVDHSLRQTYLMAVAVLNEMGFNASKLGHFNFHGLGHRLERVREIDGVLFINDSKSTTPGSTLFALDRVPRSRILLILGGKEKGIGLGEFFRGLVLHRNRILKIFTYGDFSVHEHQLQSLGFDVEAALDYEEMLQQVFIEKNKGDCVLLSPGFSSLDQLSSFEERGEKFKRFVQCL